MVGTTEDEECSLHGLCNPNSGLCICDLVGHRVMVKETTVQRETVVQLLVVQLALPQLVTRIESKLTRFSTSSA